MTLPDLRAGQIWQCRDQHHTVQIVAAQSLGADYWRVDSVSQGYAYDPPNTEAVTDEEWRCYDEYYRSDGHDGLTSNDPPWDLVQVLYDPPS